MWKCIKIQNKSFAFSSRKENNIYKVSLTDFVSLWNEELSIETIIERSKVLNPLLKIEALNIDETVGEIFSEIPEVPEIAAEESNYKIMLYKNIKGGKFKFEVNLHKGSQEEFFQTVTKLICSMTIDLLQKYSVLLKVVKEKDEEIAEYKAEGAELLRKNIETKPFTEDSLKLTEITRRESCESTLVKSLVNLCNEAEKFNLSCFENSKRCNDPGEMKIKVEETEIKTEVPQSSLLENVSSDSNVPENVVSEENSKDNQKNKCLNEKRKVKGICASFTKPSKKAKSRVKNFIS